MTTATGAWLVAAAMLAAVNWWSRWSSHRPSELWSKPLTLVALIGAAVALDPVEADVRAWFVVALSLSLTGDVLLLGDDTWFVPGLAAFAAAHVAYVVGFVVAEPWRWWAFLIAVAGLVVLAATVGRRVVDGAGRRSASLRLPVVVYLAVISAMAATASGAGDGWAVAGAALFVASDGILGWNRFVAPRTWMPVTVMVAYHLGQAGLVLSLVGVG